MPKFSVLQHQQEPMRLAVVKMFPSAEIPPDMLRAAFFSITRTSEELSLVLPAEELTDGKDDTLIWNAIKLQGPFDFSEVGILKSVAEPLANAKIGIFAISTYDTDYILVLQERLQEAVQALVDSGHTHLDTSK